MAFQKFSNMEQSLFTRFVRLGVPTVQLDAQGRARPRYRFPLPLSLSPSPPPQPTRIVPTIGKLEDSDISFHKKIFGSKDCIMPVWRLLWIGLPSSLPHYSSKTEKSTSMKLEIKPTNCGKISSFLPELFACNVWKFTVNSSVYPLSFKITLHWGNWWTLTDWTSASLLIFLGKGDRKLFQRVIEIAFSLKGDCSKGR